MSQEPIPKIRVLVAPNSMKGSLDAFRFADLVEKVFYTVSDQFVVKKMAIADGGDYTGEVLRKAYGLEKKEISVHNPLGRMISTSYGLKEGLAVIEMADSSGMKLLNNDELNPMKTSSLGMGEMVLDAIHSGAKKIFLAVGGSATVDGGMGLLEALGVQFFGQQGTLLNSSGEALGEITSWDDSALSNYSQVSFHVICDVDNPLLGDQGAVAVFAPQKGATKEMLPILENNMEHFANLVETKNKKRLHSMEGMGAAGGINLALTGFLNARIEAGADFVLDELGIDDLLADVDLVVTGEGKIDEQTKNKKAPYALALRAKQKQIPVVAIGGIVTSEGNKLFDKSYSLVDEHTSVEYAINHVEELVRKRAKELLNDILKDYGRD